MSIKAIKSSLLLGVTLGGIVTTTSAMAQAVDESATGDIIVTARRTEERLQDVPISITVFSQEAISQRNVVTATDLATYTPSLSVNQRFGPEKASYSIRGFVQENSTAPSVGVYFADVVFGRAQGGTTSGGNAVVGSFMDLQNVQVLKGPQGTLFGRNTTGGAVLLVPQKPTDRLEGYVEASAGDYGMWRGQAVLNVPLADTFKVRFAVDRNKRDGYMKNHSGIGPDNYNDVNYFAARMSIVADLTPDLENYTVATFSHSFSHGYAGRIVVCNKANPASSATPFPVSPTTLLQSLAACNQIARQNARGDGPLDVDVNNPTGLIDLYHWQAINTTTWKASDTLTVKNIASFQEFRERAFYSLNSDNFQVPAYDTLGGITGFNVNRISARLPSIIIPAGTSFQQTLLNPRGSEHNSAESTFTEELQLQGATSDGKFNYVLGGYVELARPIGWSAGRTVANANCADGANVVCTNPLLFGVISQSALKSDFTTKALFAQGTYKFTDQLSFTGGFRYTWDDIKVLANNTRLSLGVPLFNTQNTLRCNDPLTFPGGGGQALQVASPDQCPQTFVSKSSKPTWLIDLDYKPTPDLLLYAKWARGYRSGGANPTNIGLETWQPEKVDTYEVGTKFSFRGSVPGYINVAAFYNDFTNQQLVANGVASPAAQSAGFAGSQPVVNAGKSRISGFEVDGSATFFDSLRFDLGYAFIDSKLKSITPVAFPTAIYSRLVYTAVVGGPLALTPKNRLTLTGTYTLPLDESIGKISLSGTYIYTSSQYFSRADGIFTTCVAGGTDATNCPNGFNFASNVAFYGNDLGKLPATNVLNLNVNWDKVMGSPVDASFFMTNVTNDIYPVALGSALSSNGYETFQYAPPRMWGFRLRYSFGQ
jgi:iron complex outermembrane receptor protein